MYYYKTIKKSAGIMCHLYRTDLEMLSFGGTEDF